MSGPRPRVLLVCGYFDWFSGYQEVGLAKALSRVADVTVVAGDRVNPLFSDEHLAGIGASRRYRRGTTVKEGVEVVRLATTEGRSMVWARGATRAVSAAAADVVVQVMPGQVLPAAASWSDITAPRLVLYGDNSAMYAALSPSLQKVKNVIFLATKGLLYRTVNARAAKVYGYTPNTLTRLRQVSGKTPMELLPLAFDREIFYHSPQGRLNWRRRHGYDDHEHVVIVAGKVQPQKRTDFVLRAVARLRDRGFRVRLHLIGTDSGPTSRGLRRLVTELGIESLVATEGFQPATQLAQAFNGADLGVWPTMPAITIQQAMGTGLPVVLPNNDLVAHLVTSSSAGRLLPRGEDLLDALVDALTPPAQPTAASDEERAVRANDAAWLSTDALARRLLHDAGLAADG